MDRQPDRARPLSAHLPGRGHRLSGHRILADLSSSAGGLRRGPMRHAFLQPPGKDGLVACNGAGRTRRSLSLSRPPIPRSLNKETMMKQLTLLATAVLLFASSPASAAIRTVTLTVENMTSLTCGPVVKKSLSHTPAATAVQVSPQTHNPTPPHHS